MKKILQILAAVAAFASGVAGLDLAGVVQFVPDVAAPWIAAAPAFAAAWYHFVVGVGDILDDGVRNDSFGPRLLVALLIASVFLLLPSCAGLTGALTGQPIPATAVQRAGHADAPVVLVASSDLTQAEYGDPDAIWGLYDAGRAAEVIRGVVVEAGK